MFTEKGIFPKTVDINPTSKCQLKCSFCWGPDHNIPDNLSTTDWFRVISFFADHGTDSIVFTGGEPLLRHDILQLVKHAKESGMRVTLSTNTLLLPKIGSDLLPLIDEIGIPMDASNKEANGLMRRGPINGFDRQIDALLTVKKNYPAVGVTIRTVISKINIGDVLNIARLLSGYVDMYDRWKLYQFAPFSYGATNIDVHKLSYSKCLSLFNEIQTTYPHLKSSFQSSTTGQGRYIFVGSQGDIYGVNQNSDYSFVGNVLKEKPGQILSVMQGVFESEKNYRHAH